MIVLDAQNVAMRHGKNSYFSVEGMHIALEFWQKNGHQVVCFLPDYLFDYQQVNKNKQMKSMQVKEVKASKMPDNMSLLHNLADQGLVVKTPPQDYDDSYCI